ncbi:hypothetical protein V5O48_009383 [Marasmius crinis-equi]|uniref:Ribonuclease H1 N-terminal domain-containing protein n=1 Tax=Marasmius crinis-equi TaxID=585013 RepID=A0ABR3FBL2_9AGAR
MTSTAGHNHTPTPPSSTRSHAPTRRTPRSRTHRPPPVVISSDSSSSDNPDHDIDWENHFSGVFASAGISPPPSSPRIPDITTLRISSPSTPASDPPAYTAVETPDLPPYPPADASDLADLAQYYLEHYGGSVPAPDELRRSTNISSKHYTVTRGRRVGVFGDWSVVSPMVTGVSGAVYQKWGTFEEAVEMYTSAYRARMISVPEHWGS